METVIFTIISGALMIGFALGGLSEMRRQFDYNAVDTKIEALLCCSAIAAGFFAYFLHGFGFLPFCDWLGAIIFGAISAPVLTLIVGRLWLCCR